MAYILMTRFQPSVQAFICIHLGAEADEESQVAAYFRKYRGHGPAYYGDLDEANDSLLEYEVQAEEHGIVAQHLPLSPFSLTMALV